MSLVLRRQVVELVVEGEHAAEELRRLPTRGRNVAVADALRRAADAAEGSRRPVEGGAVVIDELSGLEVVLRLGDADDDEEEE